MTPRGTLEIRRVSKLFDVAAARACKGMPLKSRHVHRFIGNDMLHDHLSRTKQTTHNTNSTDKSSDGGHNRASSIVTMYA